MNTPCNIVSYKHCSRICIVANHQGTPPYGVHTTIPLIHYPLRTLVASTQQETERLVADPAPGISAAPHEDNLRYFDVTIQGPDGSPFQSAFILFRSLRAPNPPTHAHLPMNRRRLQAGTVSSGRISHEPSKGPVPHQDLPPQHR